MFNSMNSTLMTVQSSLDFRATFGKKKKPVSFVNANLTSKIGKAVKHCHRARKLIMHGGMHPLVHMHSYKSV